MIIETRDGLLVKGDCTDADVLGRVRDYCSEVDLILTDPPYGKIVTEDWDQEFATQEELADWMIYWTRLHADVLKLGGSYYIWGGIGTPGFRPFMDYFRRVEHECRPLAIANLITWGKRRAYGVQNNYLFTREECVFMVKGDPKKPSTFNIPLLEQERGYAGYNEKYPAKSKYLRRTNVWSDITEIFRGKRHPTEKPQKALSVIIETSTARGDVVFDPFAGSGSTGLAAKALGRRYILIERDDEHWGTILERLA